MPVLHSELTCMFPCPMSPSTTVYQGSRKAEQYLLMLCTLQVDPRLTCDIQETVMQRMLSMSQQQTVDPESASRILAEMYHEVTRNKILC